MNRMKCEEEQKKSFYTFTVVCESRRRKRGRVALLYLTKACVHAVKNHVALL